VGGSQKPKGSLKLAHILDQLGWNLEGWECADFGCNVGGFTRELIDRKAEKVHAIDTGYGALAWDLRNHPKVVTMERTNALHVDHLPPQDLVVCDLAWTRQSLVLPAALKAVKSGGWVVSLLKPQYEIEERPRGRKDFILDPLECETVSGRVILEMSLELGLELSLHESPIRGGKTRKGNTEYWIVVQKTDGKA
jgi:23S rRNA (cytidine1920-2'-O)/16S rRNA (cytidine1409-2'-O)-methyltransferase